MAEEKNQNAPSKDRPQASAQSSSQNSSSDTSSELSRQDQIQALDQVANLVTNYNSSNEATRPATVEAFKNNLFKLDRGVVKKMFDSASALRNKPDPSFTIQELPGLSIPKKIFTEDLKVPAKAFMADYDHRNYQELQQKNQAEASAKSEGSSTRLDAVKSAVIGTGFGGIGSALGGMVGFKPSRNRSENAKKDKNLETPNIASEPKIKGEVFDARIQTSAEPIKKLQTINNDQEEGATSEASGSVKVTSDTKTLRGIAPATGSTKVGQTNRNQGASPTINVKAEGETNTEVQANFLNQPSPATAQSSMVQTEPPATADVEINAKGEAQTHAQANVMTQGRSQTIPTSSEATSRTQTQTTRTTGHLPIAISNRSNQRRSRLNSYEKPGVRQPPDETLSQSHKPSADLLEPMGLEQASPPSIMALAGGTKAVKSKGISLGIPASQFGGPKSRTKGEKQSGSYKSIGPQDIKPPLGRAMDLHSAQNISRLDEQDGPGGLPTLEGMDLSESGLESALSEGSEAGAALPSSPIQFGQFYNPIDRRQPSIYAPQYLGPGSMAIESDEEDEFEGGGHPENEIDVLRNFQADQQQATVNLEQLTGRPNAATEIKSGSAPTGQVAGRKIGVGQGKQEPSGKLDEINMALKLLSNQANKRLGDQKLQQIKEFKEKIENLKRAKQTFKNLLDTGQIGASESLLPILTLWAEWNIDLINKHVAGGKIPFFEQKPGEGSLPLEKTFSHVKDGITILADILIPISFLASMIIPLTITALIILSSFTVIMKLADFFGISIL